MGHGESEKVESRQASGKKGGGLKLDAVREVRQILISANSTRQILILRENDLDFK